jgi:hypothetical protein
VQDAEVNLGDKRHHANDADYAEKREQHVIDAL